MPAVVLDWNLFQLTVFLKHDNNCFNSFRLSWVDKVTTGTWNFVSGIVNVRSWFAAVPANKDNFFDQVYIRLIPQLNNGISSVLQKLLRYFSGTITSASFVSLFLVFPVICCLIWTKYYYCYQQENQ